MASRVEDSISRIEKFDGLNFHLWKFKMQVVLEDKDLWNIVNGTEVEPAGQGVTVAEQDRFRKRARKALATIYLSLVDSQLLMVRSAAMAKEVWEKLEGHHKTKSLANKLFLHKRYLTTTMLENERMIDHVNKLRSIANATQTLTLRIAQKVAE